MAQTQETRLPPSVFVDLDRAGPVPLYYQIAQRLETAIHEGALPAGSRLENEVALAARLGLSRPTIRRAIQELVDKGLLVRRRGVGTQVVQGRVTRNVELTSLFDDLERSHQTPSTRILEHRVDEADAETAEHLGVEPGSPVLHLRRLRLAEGTPLALLDNRLPSRFVDLEVDQLREFGLYQVLRTRGVTISVAKQRIGARAASAAEAELLDIDPGGAVLTMERTAMDNAGQVVELGRHLYRPDLYSFETTLVDR